MLLAAVLSLALLTTGTQAAELLVLEKAVREITLVSQVASITYRLTFKNVGKSPVETVRLCYPAGHAGHTAVLEFIQDKTDSSPPLQLTPLTGVHDGAACVDALLNTPIPPGKTTTIDGGSALTQLQQPYPASVFQNEPQRVLYKDNVFILSPYKILKQTTKVVLPNKNVESYTKHAPSKLSGSTLTYGEYADVPPFSRAEMRLHFENNTPFTVATKLIREVEVSHWGNVYVEERYQIRHVGAKVRGEWSRLNLMLDPTAYGQAAVRGYVASLPPRAHSIYFKDAIGNISSSQVKGGVRATEVVLNPRYPLYGGWNVEFVLGYSVPLEDMVVKLPDSGLLRAIFLFGTPLYGLIVEDIENRVVLPEGSKVVNIEGTFDVEASRDKKFSYLDTTGRPVVVLRKKNVSFEHNQPFLVDYSFSALSLLQEPLLLVAFFAVCFAVVIAYNRCDFVITRSSEWEESQRAERTSFLVQEITSLIAEREKDVYAASNDSSQDIPALLERLKRSEEKLKRLCTELERTAGPQHSPKVRGLLEKERAVQARLAQIAAAKGQMLQQGSSQQDASAKIAEDLSTVVKGLQKSHAAQAQSLS